MVDKGERVDRAGRLMYGPGGKLIPIADRVFPVAPVAKEVDIMPAEGVALGHVLLHATARSGMTLTPIMSLPMIPRGTTPLKVCPTCQVVHPVATLHIFVDDTGTAMVSGGVLKQLKQATPTMGEFTLVGSTDKPPPLKIGQGATRQKIDYSNRAQVIYSPGKPKDPPMVVLPGAAN